MPITVNKSQPSDNNNPATVTYSCSVQLIQRRGSVPCDSLSVLGGGRSGSGSSCNGGKSRNRKKLLRRRSSGGAEMLSPIIGDDSEVASATGSGGSGGVVSSTWYRFKRDITRNRSDLDALLSRRRGSLPVEVLTVSHSGENDILFFIYTHSRLGFCLSFLF